MIWGCLLHVTLLVTLPVTLLPLYTQLLMFVCLLWPNSHSPPVHTFISP
jgi:hypothetical protein